MTSFPTEFKFNLCYFYSILIYKKKNDNSTKKKVSAGKFKIANSTSTISTGINDSDSELIDEDINNNNNDKKINGITSTSKSNNNNNVQYETLNHHNNHSETKSKNEKLNKIFEDDFLTTTF